MKDKEILAALRARVEEISVASGYNTYAGANLFLGKVYDAGNDPLPAIVITQPEDDADTVEDDETATHPQMASTFVIEAWTECDNANPMPDLMDLRADLLRACYRPSSDQPDTLGGAVSALRLIGSTKLVPAPGSSIGMAQVTLRAEYIETFGE